MILAHIDGAALGAQEQLQVAMSPGRANPELGKVQSGQVE